VIPLTRAILGALEMSFIIILLAPYKSTPLCLHFSTTLRLKGLLAFCTGHVPADLAVCNLHHSLISLKLLLLLLLL